MGVANTLRLWRESKVTRIERKWHKFFLRKQSVPMAVKLTKVV